jgi:hypothetical protein
LYKVERFENDIKANYREIGSEVVNKRQREMLKKKRSEKEGRKTHPIDL